MLTLQEISRRPRQCTPKISRRVHAGNYLHFQDINFDYSLWNPSKIYKSSPIWEHQCIFYISCLFANTQTIFFKMHAMLAKCFEWIGLSLGFGYTDELFGTYPNNIWSIYQHMKRYLKILNVLSSCIFCQNHQQIKSMPGQLNNYF